MRRALEKVLETVSVICSACNKTYKTPLFRYKFNKKRKAKFRFCSKECRGKIFELIGFKKKTTWIKLMCFSCKKNFRTSKTNNYVRVVRKTKKSFCSVKCKTKAQRLGGELSPSWKGGRRVFPSTGGYVMLNLGPNKRMFEHRFLMEKKLKRKLKLGEVVHHRNGNPSDNRIDNLVICKSAGYHTSKFHPRKRKIDGKFTSLQA